MKRKTGHTSRVFKVEVDESHAWAGGVHKKRREPGHFPSTASGTQELRLVFHSSGAVWLLSRITLFICRGEAAGHWARVRSEEHPWALDPEDASVS